MDYVRTNMAVKQVQLNALHCIEMRQPKAVKLLFRRAYSYFRRHCILQLCTARHDRTLLDTTGHNWTQPEATGSGSEDMPNLICALRRNIFVEKFEKDRQEMKRSYTAPDDFEPTPEQIKWAIDTFRISKNEVLRQTEEWKDFEYKRAYFDWNRAWKRWFRQAEKFDTLKRERVYRKPEEVTEEQRQEDIRRWNEDMRRLRVVR